MSELIPPNELGTLLPWIRTDLMADIYANAEVQLEHAERIKAMEARMERFESMLRDKDGEA